MGSILYIFPNIVTAQTAVLPSGGNAVGSGGTSSFSVGQSFYISKGSDNEIVEGVQQPYEITNLATVESGSLGRGIKIYPNPVSDILVVEFDYSILDNYDYNIFDMQGKLIQKGHISSSKYQLDLDSLPVSVYVFQILQNNKLIKSFKIIKKL